MARKLECRHCGAFNTAGTPCRCGGPKSNAERQAIYRARKASDKLQEVRGIFATEENALKIRQFAESLKT